MKQCFSERGDKTEFRQFGEGEGGGVLENNNNNKGFINLRFLQKINCQMMKWDQARFSSLV